LILFVGGCWARRQLHAGIRYVSVASELRNSLSSVEGVLCSNPGGILLDGRLLHDYLTDSNWFAVGCWAQRQLHAGIRYVSVASKLRTSLTSVEGMLGSNPGGILLDGRLLHGYLTDSNSVCGRLLGSTPATRRYKVGPYAINTHGFTLFCRGRSL